MSAAEGLGRGLVERYPEGVVVLLVGPLGAGKTVMARGIARGIGVEEPVTSPTYTIISDYQATRGTLHHVDLYRIEGAEQIENLGLDDIMRGGGIVLIEWGEKLERTAGGAAIGPHVRVTISVAADGGRDITVEERAG
jgi:tRNA threonylcarbamoyladenosine biosynthesis protein TsaE